MRISTRLRYGLRAMVEIARHFGGAPIKRKTIVEQQEIPDSYLENLLIALKKSGIIQTVRGAKGGYRLIRSPHRVTVLEVVEALEGPIAPIDCLDESNGNCNRTARCATRPLWERLAEAHRTVLADTTIQDLLDGEQSEYVMDFSI